ncbi:hypothetical protein [Pseudoflavonifractor capillosus]|uniref:hypothetical protein n=1 Tax=Pseudoflavonifractor capillosus TaxID=106588 RepID=UPI001FAFA604|nr:hypothetical protein [Pseudoflavonifractor capillosus]
MQKGNSYTIGQWCDRWFCENQSRWSGSTVGGYRKSSDSKWGDMFSGVSLHFFCQTIGPAKIMSAAEKELNCTRHT